DFLRALTEPFDALARLLNGFAYGVHAIDRAPNRIAAFVGDIYGMPCDVRAALGVARYLLDGSSHVGHGFAGRGNLPRLGAAGFRHVRRRALSLLRRTVQLNRAVVDG